MYNQKLINILLKILGWITIVVTVLFFVSGFFVAANEHGSAPEKVAYWIGYEVAGLAMIVFFYVLLGIMYRINNSK